MSDVANAHFFRTADGLNLHYRDFGSQNDGTPVICLPGLTRSCRDFEAIARRLSDRRRVLTVDFRGRGASDYDSRWENYVPATYVADTVALLESLAIDRVIVIGSSLGGLCGMAMAVQSGGKRVAGIVLNDIGPEINPAGIERLLSYIGRLPPVANWDEAISQVREVHGPALPGLSDADFEALARRSFREDEKGVPVLDFDPGIGRAVREAAPPEGDSWAQFATLGPLPMTLIWGERSDILTADIVARMQAAKPDLEVVPLANRGHVPLLDEPDSVAAIDAFLARVP
jgi:pimeloyl-ACP methyl ester carboxylesterase